MGEDWMRELTKNIVGIVILTLAIPAYAEELIGKVVSIADGDTVTILDSSQIQHKIRLAGIDAPERNQPFGNVSRQNLSDLVFQKQVRIETEKKDRYGRLVGKIWVEPTDCSGCGMTLDANLAQVKAGLAWWYRDYADEQSEVDQRQYEFAEREAKGKGVGLWRETEPLAPWDWRRELSSASDAPDGCEIKGNINSDGVRIYHSPSQRSYAATRIDVDKGERWFCNSEEAIDAGWRAPN